MSPWDIIEFKQFLNTEELFVLSQVASIQVKEIVRLVFEILQSDLDKEMKKEDNLLTKQER